MEYNPAAASESAMRTLLGALVRLLRPALVVETGCYFGDAAEVIGWALAGAGGRLVSCDIDAALVARTIGRCMGLPVEVRHCRGDELPELAQADLVFIDSDYAARPREIALCKPGAVVVVHDTRVSHDSRVEPLEGLVCALGGISLPSERGFGILVKR